MNIENELQKRIKTQLGDKDYRTLKLSYGFCLKFAQDMVNSIFDESAIRHERVKEYQIKAELRQLELDRYAEKLRDFANERGIDIGNL